MSKQPSDTNHKKYNINRDSWHYKFNHWTYGHNEPQSFCPYFWGTLLAIPIAPLVALGKAIIYAKDKYDSKPKVERAPRISTDTKENIGVGMVLFLLIGIPTILLTYGLIYEFESTLRVLGVVGVILGVIGGLILSVIMIGKAYTSYRRKHPKAYKEKQPNMISLGLKSWYHKNCPLVEYK